MEKNEEFQKVVANIQQLEAKLVLIDEYTQTNERYSAEVEADIEEYFSKCVNALAARKEVLMRDLAKISSTQRISNSDVRNEVAKALAARKKLLEAGSFVYDTTTSMAAAEHVWKGVSNLPQPKDKIFRMKLDLSNSLFESIQTHGQVLLVSVGNEEILDTAKEKGKENENANNEKEKKEKEQEKEQEKDEQKQKETGKPQNELPFAVVVEMVKFAGATPGLADGRGDQAKFNTPRGICWNPNDDCLYVCDKRNNSIRKITLQGDVSTFVRGSAGQLSWPQEIVFHHQSKSFFVTNEYAHTIAKISSDGVVSVLAGSGKIEFQDGVGAAASFCYPTGIAISQQTGTIFVTDYNNHAIRKVTLQGEVSTVAGSAKCGYADGKGENAKFNGPWGIYFDEFAQELLICDYDNNKLRRMSLEGEVSTLCEIPRPSLATSAGNFIFVASDENKIFKVSREGVVSVLEQQEKEGDKTKECKFSSTIGLAVHEASKSCFLAGGHSITKVIFK